MSDLSQTTSENTIAILVQITHPLAWLAVPVGGLTATRWFEHLFPSMCSPDWQFPPRVCWLADQVSKDQSGVGESKRNVVEGEERKKERKNERMKEEEVQQEQQQEGTWCKRTDFSSRRRKREVLVSSSALRDWIWAWRELLSTCLEVSSDCKRSVSNCTFFNASTNLICNPAFSFCTRSNSSAGADGRSDLSVSERGLMISKEIHNKKEMQWQDRQSIWMIKYWGNLKAKTGITKK